MNFKNALCKNLIIIGIICFWITAIQSENTSRIVGGATAAIADFPYQALVRISGQPICGGVIINIKYVLTAGHCVYTKSGFGVPAELLSVRVGSNQLFESGTIVDVVEVKVHPQFKHPRFDVALLKLVANLQLTSLIQAIPITSQHVSPGNRLTVTGWGATSTGGSPVTTLRQVELTVVDNKLCYKDAPYNPTAFCMSSPPGKGICKGDSGGPAVYNGRLIGIVSFSRGACGTSKLDGFAKVAYMYNWLSKNSIL